MRLKDSICCVFGGSGTIGREIVKKLILEEVNVIRIFTNDENGLFEMEQEFGDSLLFRYILGDIKDGNAVKRALENVDYAFNCAAIKHVKICEYNPMEAVRVNIEGLNNVIDGCFANDVKKLVHVSTDKAVEPSNVMGDTKSIGERLCASREESKGCNTTIISCVRLGNVLGSRGSLVPKIQSQIEKGNVVTLTDKRMKRYLIEKPKAGQFIMDACKLARGGEIFVPKLEEKLVIDLINDIIVQYAPLVGKNAVDITIKEIGIQPGEKLREKLIADNENYEETEDMYVIR